MTAVVGVLVAVGMLAVVPLGLQLLATPGAAALARAWPAAGTFGVASLCLPTGASAALAAVPYALACAVAGTLAVARVVRVRVPAGAPASGSRRHGRRELLREATALTALGCLPVAGVFLVADRAGHALLGFDADVVALTVAHFHFAGFAAAVLAGIVLVRAPGPLSELAAGAVPVGTATVALGHFLGREVELLGAVVMSTGVLALSAATVRHALPRDQPARRLLIVAAWTTPLTMSLALWWAAGRALDLPHLGLAATAATHGAGNALGLCLCGLLAWVRLRPEPV